MAEQNYHLAQISISLAKEPLDHAMMQPFVAQLGPINTLADSQPGFIWRLQTEEGNSTDVRGFDNPLMLLNMSLWESIKDLKNFVFKSAHSGPYRNARQWFEVLDYPVTALWWVKEGHTPTVEEGLARLESVQNIGASPFSFGFRGAYDTPKIGDELSLVERCEREVIELHEFFQSWFCGEIGQEEGHLLARRFAQNSRLITPDGEVEQFYSLEKRFLSAYGKRPGVKVWTSHFVPLMITHDSALVKYREWRLFNEELTGRLTTCLFKLNDEAPNGIEWSHIHESWLKSD